MAINYDKYLIRQPLYESYPGVKNRQSPAMTYLSSAQVPEANYYLESGWIYGVPEPNENTQEHVHDYDEIILFWGSDHTKPQTLGAEIEFAIAGQKIEFNTTAGIYIPKGIPHGPFKWNNVQRPHMQMSLIIGTGNYAESRGKKPSASNVKSELSVDFDYEQYVIRSPIREAGAEFVSGRTVPTMTYMSGLHIPGMKNYIEFGWTFGVPVSKRISGPNAQMPSMAHQNFDEIVVHMGGDPENPEDLGGEIEFWVGGKPLTFSTSSVLFVPKGLLHGPIKLNQYRKPHIVMAIMLGIGNVKEGWSANFKDDKTT